MATNRRTVQHKDEREQENMVRQKSRRRRSVAALTACLVALLVLGAAGYVYYQLPHRCVKEDVTIEAGAPCPAVADFLEWPCKEAVIVSGISEDMVFSHVQDYEVIIHLYHQDITTMLHVVDTIPPELQTKDKVIMLDEDIQPEDFVEKVSDVTAYEVFWQEEPKIPGAGTYTLSLAARDEGGNITEAEAFLTVLQDVTPPVIDGVEEITIRAGESVSYKKNVTVTDDYDDAVELEVDNSQVDIDTPGDYTVWYRATDKYGNKAEVSTVLHVKKPVVIDQVIVTEELVNAEADKILASITDPSMSQYEILEAIYNWCKYKIAYISETPKTDWVIGAYYGLVKRKGDCYAYAMSAKCLLDRAGITNMEIERIRYGNGMHFWNLVDIGEGWHHFDSCRQVGNETLVYMTDAELMEFSAAHTGRGYPNGSHYYDRSLYPEIP